MTILLNLVKPLTSHCEVVEWVVEAMLRLVAEPKEGAVVTEHKVAGAPRLDMFTCITHVTSSVCLSQTLVS